MISSTTWAVGTFVVLEIRYARPGIGAGVVEVEVMTDDC